MTIYLDSRYADGTLARVNDARNGNYSVTVYRNFPTYTTKFFWYEWVTTDRLDTLALKWLGNAELWWQIMDINPEILDVFDLSPGTQIRIPHE